MPLSNGFLNNYLRTQEAAKSAEKCNPLFMGFFRGLRKFQTNLEPSSEAERRLERWKKTFVDQRWWLRMAAPSRMRAAQPPYSTKRHGTVRFVEVDSVLP